MYSNRDWDWRVSLLIFGLMLLVAGPFSWYYETQTVSSIQGKVVDQYIKRTGYGRSARDHFHIVVQMEDGQKEVFWNDDSLFNWKFRSADIQQELEVGKSYTFKVYGFRNGFLSWFRNIVEAKPLE